MKKPTDRSAPAAFGGAAAGPAATAATPRAYRPPSGPAARTRGAPTVWLLRGERHGDNGQLEALACDLGWPVTRFELRYNALHMLPNAWLGATRLSFDETPRCAPPWPDLVLGIGRRAAPAARWIQRQARDRTRLVWLGRPRLATRHFDLVVTTAQYGIGHLPGVVELTLPYQNACASAPPLAPVAADAPVVAVLGGTSWTAAVDAASVDHLAAAARRLAAHHGRPLVATTSPRTPPALGQRLQARLGPAVPCYDWSRMRGRDNPYAHYLASAAAFVITGDSVSMLAETLWTGRPVSVLRLPERPWLRTARALAGGAVRKWFERAGNWGLAAPPPNLEALLRTLAAAGTARVDGTGLLTLEGLRPRLEAERRALCAHLEALLRAPRATSLRP